MKGREWAYFFHMIEESKPYLMDVTIRTMRRKDISSVQQVATESWHDTYAEIIPERIRNRFLQSAYDNNTLRRRMKYSHMIVAEVNHEVVGFAQFSRPDEANNSLLNAIYIYPHYQGKGIGSKLLQAGINRLETAKAIYLHVEKGNDQGIQFYQARDFEVVAETEEQFIGHQLQTIQMVLKLK